LVNNRTQYEKDVDNNLLISLSKGDKNAFSALYHSFKSRVYRIVFAYLNNAEDTEEVVQDVFLKLYQSAHHFHAQCSASTWIYRIAVNKSLDKLRFNRAKMRFAFITSLFDMSNGELMEIEDPSHHGIDAEKRENLKILLKALEKVPIQQRTALVLTQIEELSGKETAIIMNVTAKAVEGLIQRGKANLKKVLEKIYDDQRK
jgi:RNA polymerase sigma factor (sigma-70 family)